MRLVLKSIVTAIFAIAFSVSAFAAENRVVPANRASAIFFYYTVDTYTCYNGGKPTFNLGGKPAHGTITTRWQASKMGGESWNCKGKPMKGLLVIYKPTPGYHGPDKVKFAFSTQFGEFLMHRSYTVNITVK
jgi:hypothetical protein